MQPTTEATSSTGVSNQLATLVPTFDPAKDDVTVYGQKVQLVLAAWPKTKISELVTRLILNCQGSAFQKLQLHHAELLTGDEASVAKLVEILGGTWGIQEFHVQLVARAIKESLKEGISLRWVHTGAQLADCLTKAGRHLLARNIEGRVLQTA